MIESVSASQPTGIQMERDIQEMKLEEKVQERVELEQVLDEKAIVKDEQLGKIVDEQA
jgi:hypothetical protein